MRILVTGARGMIGSKLVDALLAKGYSVIGVDLAEPGQEREGYVYCRIDLSQGEELKRFIAQHQPDRIIHLAALAHTGGENDLSWERYYHVNVECARNVFEAAGDKPVLFISTVDVYGFGDGTPVTPHTLPQPVSSYGKSKRLAEEECMRLPHFTIFRFSPVYTDTVKRDIQKRYYLKYPSVAYRIGKGSAYEVLNVRKAAEAMVRWCAETPRNEIQILKDDAPLWTPDAIAAEKRAGRAKLVLPFPRWAVKCGYAVLLRLLGQGEKTYLLNKAVYPLKSES